MAPPLLEKCLKCRRQLDDEGICALHEEIGKQHWPICSGCGNYFNVKGANMENDYISCGGCGMSQKNPYYWIISQQSSVGAQASILTSTCFKRTNIDVGNLDAARLSDEHSEKPSLEISSTQKVGNLNRDDRYRERESLHSASRSDRYERERHDSRDDRYRERESLRSTSISDRYERDGRDTRGSKRRSASPDVQYRDSRNDRYRSQGPDTTLKARKPAQYPTGATNVTTTGNSTPNPPLGPAATQRPFNPPEGPAAYLRGSDIFGGEVKGGRGISRSKGNFYHGHSGSWPAGGQQQSNHPWNRQVPFARRPNAPTSGHRSEMTIGKIIAAKDVDFSVTMSLEDAITIFLEGKKCSEFTSVEQIYAALRLLQSSIEEVSSRDWQKSRKLHQSQLTKDFLESTREVETRLTEEGRTAREKRLNQYLSKICSVQKGFILTMKNHGNGLLSKVETDISRAGRMEQPGYRDLIRYADSHPILQATLIRCATQCSEKMRRAEALSQERVNA